MSDYDSRRTGNGLLDTGSTPVWSTEKVLKMPECRFFKNFFLHIGRKVREIRAYELFHNSLDIVPVWR